MAELEVDAYPPGVRPETNYRAVEARLDPGDCVVFCSDGIIEARDPEGDIFGFERTAEVVSRRCAAGTNAEGIIEAIFEEVRSFAAGAPQGDDQTVVVVKVQESQQNRSE